MMIITNDSADEKKHENGIDEEVTAGMCIV
jgi:hypothetical protein